LQTSDNLANAKRREMKGQEGGEKTVRFSGAGDKNTESSSEKRGDESTTRHFDGDHTKIPLKPIEKSGRKKALQTSEGENRVLDVTRR